MKGLLWEVEQQVGRERRDDVAEPRRQERVVLAFLQRRLPENPAV